MQIRIHQLGPGMVQQIQTVCSECRGEGETIDPKHMCKNCNGKKVTRERKILEVHIDKGNGQGKNPKFIDFYIWVFKGLRLPVSLVLTKCHYL